MLSIQENRCPFPDYPFRLRFVLKANNAYECSSKEEAWVIKSSF